MGEWRARVRVGVVEDGTDRPGSEIEAETTVDAPGPQTAIMAALRWAMREAPKSDPAYGPPPPEFEHVEDPMRQLRARDAADGRRRVRVRGRVVDENSDERGDYVDIEVRGGLDG